jgi:isopentenyldiphosphate isomerase
MFRRPLSPHEAAKIAEKEPVVTIVNRKGFPVGYASEKEVHCCNPIDMHRGIQIIVVSADRKEIVARYRTSGEHQFHWVNAGVTHVYYGEEFSDAARREINQGLGLGITKATLENRLKFLFLEKPCLGTNMEFIRVYSLVLNSGEFVKSKDPLQTFTLLNLVNRLDELDRISPTFRLIMRNFAEKIVVGSRWRNAL